MLIKLGNIDNRFWLLVLMLFFRILCKYCYRFSIDPANTLWTLLTMSIGEAFIYVVYLIIHNKQKKYIKKKVLEGNVLEEKSFLIEENVQKISEIKVLLFAFAYAALDWGDGFFIFSMHIGKKFGINGLSVCLEFFCLSLICKFFFQYDYYKHHYVAGGLMIMGVCIAVITSIAVDPSNYSGKDAIFIICEGFFYCSITSLIRFVTFNYSVNPLKLAGYAGIINLLLTFIIPFFMMFTGCWEKSEGSPIDWCEKDNKFDFGEYFGSIFDQLGKNKLLILSIFLDIFSLFSYNAINPMVVYLLGPLHKVTSDFSSILILTLVEFFEETNMLETTLSFIGFAIIFFSLCMFNEIIILKFWGLDNNVKNEINERSQEEYMLANEDYNLYKNNPNNSNGRASGATSDKNDRDSSIHYKDNDSQRISCGSARDIGSGSTGIFGRLTKGLNRKTQKPQDGRKLSACVEMIAEEGTLITNKKMEEVELEFRTSDIKSGLVEIDSSSNTNTDNGMNNGNNGENGGKDIDGTL